MSTPALKSLILLVTFKIQLKQCIVCAVLRVLRDRSSYVIGKLSSKFRALLLVAPTKDIFFLTESETMSAFWRAAGLTYVNYSSIAAKVTRQALKAGPVKVRQPP